MRSPATNLLQIDRVVNNGSDLQRRPIELPPIIPPAQYRINLIPAMHSRDRATNIVDQNTEPLEFSKAHSKFE